MAILTNNSSGNFTTAATWSLIDTTSLLDTKVSTELKEEGVARDIIRVIQDKRKEMNLVPSDEIAVSISGKQHIVDALTRFEEEIRRVTNAKKISFGVGELSKSENEFEVVIEKVNS